MMTFSKKMMTMIDGTSLGINNVINIYYVNIHTI